MNGFNRLPKEEANTNPNAAKDKLEEFRGTFSGKLFKGQGVGKKGEWQRFKLVFLMDGKEINFTAFNPMSAKGLQVGDLVEGTDYVVVYKKSYFTADDGSEAYSKSAVLIKLSSGQQSLSSSATKGMTGQQTVTTSPPNEVQSSPVTPPLKFDMGVDVDSTKERDFSILFMEMVEQGKLKGIMEEYLPLYQKNISEDALKCAAAWKKYILKEN